MSNMVSTFMTESQVLLGVVENTISALINANNILSGMHFGGGAI